MGNSGRRRGGGECENKCCEIQPKAHGGAWGKRRKSACCMHSLAPSIATQVISIHSGETQCSGKRQNIEVNGYIIVVTDDGPENKVLKPDSLPRPQKKTIAASVGLQSREPPASRTEETAFEWQMHAIANPSDGVEIQRQSSCGLTVTITGRKTMPRSHQQPLPTHSPLSHLSRLSMGATGTPEAA